MPDNSITVAAGSPDDLRSSIWVMWVNGDDVYFSPRFFNARTMKVSLHKSGDWRIAWIEPQKNEKNSDRLIMRWRRPTAHIRGIISGVAVLIDPFFPKEPFRNRAILDPTIKWLPLALYGKALALWVLIAKKDADLGAGRFPPNERILGRLKKANGEHAILLAQDATLTTEMKQAIFSVRSDLKIHLRKDQVEQAQMRDVMRLLGLPKGNTALGTVPTIYDLSLGWENVVLDLK